MIETRRLKNVVIFIQTVLSFVLSRNIRICGSHLKCKFANKCLNVCEQIEVVQSNKDGSLPSPDVLWITTVDERKP